ncbi:MAG TPA: Rrf2 family transcriptional regulator [Flavobacteriales bacterium]|nr:Rrf2 family transcriptional regulator [Flavobacteriales bacterium]
MKLTTKGRYAVTAMLDLVLHQQDKPVTLAGISRRQGLSLSYLEQLFSKLRKAGLVSSARGPGGGYSLSPLMTEVSVGDIIAAVDEDVEVNACKGMKNCQDGEMCLAHELWCDLSDRISAFLGDISLNDLINNPNVQKVAARQQERETLLKDISVTSNI